MADVSSSSQSLHWHSLDCLGSLDHTGSVKGDIPGLTTLIRRQEGLLIKKCVYVFCPYR